MVDETPMTNCYPSTYKHNKQKLQILEVLHIRMKQPKPNKINFESSTNVLKCL